MDWLNGMVPIFSALATKDLDDAARLEVAALFRQTYREANEAYLQQSLARLRFIAMARVDDALVGFALGEMRRMDLPRLPQQAVALAGMCCVDVRFRRRGLFRELEGRAFLAANLAPFSRLLSCGRVAHPASFRTITAVPNHVPKHGVAPTPWQRDVAAAIAAVYGVAHFDPDTFVCRGSGTAIGFPVMEMEVRPDEWGAFASVDRTRGDSLLGLCWMPDAPDGW